jgi:hypothetical protein
MRRYAMAYTRTNYRSKKALREDLAAGVEVEVYQPGPFGPNVPDGRHALYGPHFPEPHKWYASVQVAGGKILKLLK